MVLAEKACRVMAFSEVERVVFSTNPLEEVICQLRFPSILRIDTESPVQFQEAIRDKYPLYTLQAAMPLGLPSELAGVLSRDFPLVGGQTTHQFGSIDERFALTLNRDSIALVCKRYERWEEFREQFEQGLSALIRHYSPSFFIRIGLRYKNVIRRSKLDLGRTSWSDLLRPWIAGAYSSPEMRDDIESNFAQLLLRLRNERGKVLVNCGTLKDGDEECYLIDADFFLDRKTEAPLVLEGLDFLNRESGRFFHWCITDRLRDALSAAAVSSL